MLSLVIATLFSFHYSKPAMAYELAHLAQESMPSVPGKEAAEKIRRKIHETYPAKFAKAKLSNANASALAAELLEESKLIVGEPDAKYGILAEALDLSIQGLDLDIAFVVIDSLEANFEDFDKTIVGFTTLMRVSERIQSSQVEKAGEAAVAFSSDLIKREELRESVELLEAFRMKIRRYGSDGLKERHQSLIEEAQKGLRVQNAFETVQSNPEDVNANEIVGLHLAFVIRDFERALPYLVKGNDKPLTLILESEVSPGEDSHSWIGLADSWVDWSRAQDEIAFKRIGLERALSWYLQAQEGLSYLDKVPVQKKVEATHKELTELPSENASSPVDGRKATSLPGELFSKLSRKRSVAVEHGVNWLVNHQSQNGSWDADGFSMQCKVDEGEEVCSGVGAAMNDIGITGLALSALLPFSTSGGTSQVDLAVDRGLTFLLENQSESGWIGDPISGGISFAYCHAYATQALISAFVQSKDSALAEAGLLALEAILRAQNPYNGWRYGIEPNGDNDGSCTTLMLVTLAEASRAGLNLEFPRLSGALDELRGLTNKKTGRVAYTSNFIDSPFGAIPKYKRDIGTEGKISESLTAAGLMALESLRPKEKEDDLREKGRLLVLSTPPEWDSSSLENNFYYWFYGTRFVHRSKSVKSKDQQVWNKALDSTLLPQQEGHGHQRGSWAASGVWGEEGGRVYSTALAILCLTEKGS